MDVPVHQPYIIEDEEGSFDVPADVVVNYYVESGGYTSEMPSPALPQQCSIDVHTALESTNVISSAAYHRFQGDETGATTSASQTLEKNHLPKKRKQSSQNRQFTEGDLETSMIAIQTEISDSLKKILQTMEQLVKAVNIIAHCLNK